MVKQSGSARVKACLADLRSENHTPDAWDERAFQDRTACSDDYQTLHEIGEAIRDRSLGADLSGSDLADARDAVICVLANAGKGPMGRNAYAYARAGIEEKWVLTARALERGRRSAGASFPAGNRRFFPGVEGESRRFLGVRLLDQQMNPLVEVEAGFRGEDEEDGGSVVYRFKVDGAELTAACRRS